MKFKLCSLRSTNIEINLLVEIKVCVCVTELRRDYTIRMLLHKHLKYYRVFANNLKCADILLKQKKKHKHVDRRR